MKKEELTKLGRKILSKQGKAQSKFNIFFLKNFQKAQKMPVPNTSRNWSRRDTIVRKIWVKAI